MAMSKKNMKSRANKSRANKVKQRKLTILSGGASRALNSIETVIHRVSKDKIKLQSKIDEIERQTQKLAIDRFIHFITYKNSQDKAISVCDCKIILLYILQYKLYSQSFQNKIIEYIKQAFIPSINGKPSEQSLNIKEFTIKQILLLTNFNLEKIGLITCTTSYNNLDEYLNKYKQKYKLLFGVENDSSFNEIKNLVLQFFAKSGDYIGSSDDELLNTNIFKITDKEHIHNSFLNKMGRRVTKFFSPRQNSVNVVTPYSKIGIDSGPLYPTISRQQPNTDVITSGWTSDINNNVSRIPPSNPEPRTLRRLPISPVKNKSLTQNLQTTNNSIKLNYFGDVPISPVKKKNLPNNPQTTQTTNNSINYNPFGSLLNSNPVMTRRQTKYKKPSNNTELDIKHFWYRKFPDHGAPSDMDIFKIFISEILTDIYETPGSTVIHCSAGVGRTGLVSVILSISILLKNNNNNEPYILNNEKQIFEYIQNGRLNRQSFVQSDLQYIFICKYFGIEIPILVENFKNLQPNPYIRKPFTNCKNKNRYSNIVPYDDDSRVKLESNDGEPCSDYINASFLDNADNGFGRFIATQCPTQNTQQDFFKMLKQQNIVRIIRLTEDSENGREKCFNYFSNNTDQVVTKLIEIPTSESYNISKCKLKTEGDNYELNVISS